MIASRRRETGMINRVVLDRATCCKKRNYRTLVILGALSCWDVQGWTDRATRLNRIMCCCGMAKSTPRHLLATPHSVFRKRNLYSYLSNGMFTSSRISGHQLTKRPRKRQVELDASEYDYNVLAFHCPIEMYYVDVDILPARQSPRPVLSNGQKADSKSKSKVQYCHLILGQISTS